MSTIYIRGEPCELLARVRQAGLPFEDQAGDLIGIDYQDYTGGGACNVRLTRDQAHALRDALHIYLTRGPLTHTIAKRADGHTVSQTELMDGAVV
jgi:hypothetical protein